MVFDEHDFLMKMDFDENGFDENGFLMKMGFDENGF